VNVLDVFWIIVFLVLFLVAIFTSVKILGHWLTPLSIFIGINSISIIMYHFRFLNLTGVSTATHLVVISAFISFVIGVTIITVLKPAHNITNQNIIYNTRNLSRFFYITICLATMGWVLQSILLVMKYGIGGLVTNIWILQNEFQVQYVGYLNVIGILVLPTYFIKKTISKANKTDLILTLLSLFGLFLAGNKSYLFWSVISGVLVMGAVKHQHFKIRHMFIPAIILVGFFIIYDSTIDIFAPDVIQGNGLAQQDTKLNKPYLYFTGSWPAMEMVASGHMEDLPQTGFATLQPLWKIASFCGLADKEDKSHPFTNIGPSEFNVYSFVGEVYWEWRLPGVMLFSFLLGFVSNGLYLRTRQSGYWGHVLVYSIFVYGVVLSFFMYRFRFKMFLLLVFVYFIGFVVLRNGIFIDKRTGSIIKKDDTLHGKTD
jgi:oligosaccharide repeat unit polymerase